MSVERLLVSVFVNAEKNPFKSGPPKGSRGGSEDSSLIWTSQMFWEVFALEFLVFFTVT